MLRIYKFDGGFSPSMYGSATTSTVISLLKQLNII